MKKLLLLLGLACIVITSSCSSTTQTRAITGRPLEGGSWHYSPEKSTLELILHFDALGAAGKLLRQEASVWRDGKHIYVAGLFIDISDGNTLGRKDDFRAKASITSIKPGTYTVIDAYNGEAIGELNTASGEGTLFRIEK